MPNIIIFYLFLNEQYTNIHILNLSNRNIIFDHKRIHDQKAFADFCMGIIACSAIAGDVGDGGSCYALTIGNHCGGSTGSNEPRGGAGGAGGDAVIGNSDHEGGSNSDTETTTITNPNTN